MPDEKICRLDGNAHHPASEAAALPPFLEPDSKRRFQRRRLDPVKLHEHLVEEVQARFGSSRPRLILCCGKCRVGSTPLANVFGHSGLPTFYQPIKTLLRHLLVDQACPHWTLETEEPVVFIKETFGPYVDAECSFDPLKVLLDAGFRENDITLLLIERDPMTTLASWWHCWQDRIESDVFLDRFFAASSNVHRLAGLADRTGIPVEFYLHEESKTPEIAMPNLFERLGLGQRFSPSVMQGWTRGDSLTGSNTAVTFFRQPSDYCIEEIHLDLDEYRFVRRQPASSKFVLREQDMAMIAALDRLYQTAKDRAAQARLAGSESAPSAFKQRLQA